MPDISMCPGENNGQVCELREECYRYRAKPNAHRQSWFVPDSLGKNCKYYWPGGVWLGSLESKPEKESPQ